MKQQVMGWRKSSRSSQQTDCVEVGQTANDAAVRDTKNRQAGYFTATTKQWQSFITTIESDRF